MLSFGSLYGFESRKRAGKQWEVELQQTRSRIGLVQVQQLRRAGRLNDGRSPVSSIIISVPTMQSHWHGHPILSNSLTVPHGYKAARFSFLLNNNTSSSARHLQLGQQGAASRPIRPRDLVSSQAIEVAGRPAIWSPTPREAESSMHWLPAAFDQEPLPSLDAQCRRG